MDSAFDAQSESTRTCSSTTINSSLLSEKICLATASEYESYIALAVEAFKAQDLRSLKAVKDFFTVLPSPVEIEQVLAAAVYQTAKLDLDSCRWLLRHPHYLMPELDLVDLAVKMVWFRLQSCGFLPGQDFELDSPQSWKLLSSAAISKLNRASRTTEIATASRPRLQPQELRPCCFWQAQLALSEAAKATLLQSSSVGDRLLFKELLQIGD